MTGQPDRLSVNPKVAWAGAVLVLGAVVVATLGFLGSRAASPPPPAEVAADPLLAQGREVFLGRCASCHGTVGRGDGPLAKGLAGPRVGDLTAKAWKHGEAPDQVLGVLRVGVRDSAMPGWKGILDDADVRASAAYVYYLGGRPIPDALRRP